MSGFAVVQKLTTRWAKAFRGNERAAKRNSTPDALRVPLTSHPETGKLLIHSASYSYWQCSSVDTPTENFEILEPKRPFRMGCVVVEFVPSGLHTTYRYEPRDVGAPYRTDLPREFDLKLGEWLQIIYNGRFTEEGSWYYQKVVMNVGLFDQFNTEVFLQLQPKKTFSDLQALR